MLAIATKTSIVLLDPPQFPAELTFGPQYFHSDLAHKGVLQTQFSIFEWWRMLPGKSLTGVLEQHILVSVRSWREGGNTQGLHLCMKVLHYLPRLVQTCCVIWLEVDQRPIYCDTSDPHPSLALLFQHVQPASCLSLSPEVNTAMPQQRFQLQRTRHLAPDCRRCVYLEKSSSSQWLFHRPFFVLILFSLGSMNAAGGSVNKGVITLLYCYNYQGNNEVGIVTIMNRVPQRERRFET